MYTCIFALTTIGLCAENSKTKSLSGLMVAVYLAVCAGLAQEFSRDYAGYVEVYNNTPDLFQLFSGSWPHLYVEPLYLIGSSIFKTLGFSVEVWFFLIAAATSFFNYQACKKISPFIGLSLLCYFCHQYLYKDLTQIRNGISSAIGLWAMSAYVCDSENKKFAATIVVASLFHSAALVLFFVFFFKEKYVAFFLNKWIWVFLVSIALYMVDITRVIAILASLSLLPVAIANYVNDTDFNMDVGLLNPTTLKQVFIFLVYVFVIAHKKTNKIDAKLAFIYLLSIVWLIVFSRFAIMAARVATFFSTVEILLVPRIISYTSGWQRLFLIIGIVVLYSLIFFVNVNYKNLYIDDYKSIVFSTPTT